MPLKPAILLDSNAGAPLHPKVREALFAFLDSAPGRGNPASSHSFGRESAAFIADADRLILSTFRVTPRDWQVTYTSGGTEANQLAIRTARDLLRKGELHPTWGVSLVEHACVLGLREEWKKGEGVVLEIAPDQSGVVTELKESKEQIDLLSVIGVGNETGLIQPSLTSHIQSAKNLPATKRPFYHVDYVAGWGKAELDLSQSDAPDFIAIAGHKLGGVPGSGALIHRKSIKVERHGTPNLIGIASLRAIAELWPVFVDELRGLKELRDRFEDELLRRFGRVRITGRGLARVPNVSQFYFADLPKNLSLVSALDLRGFAVSAGSACSSQIPEPSHVLLAMGVPAANARNALRVSLHPGNRWEDLAGLLDALTEILRRHET